MFIVYRLIATHDAGLYDLLISGLDVFHDSGQSFIRGIDLLTVALDVFYLRFTKVYEGLGAL